ncbi:hypothetical protein D3C76_914610 [compost metagenome]
MHITQRTVQVGLVLRLDMRHTTAVVAHADRSLQRRQHHFAFTLGQLALHIPGAGTDADGSDGEGKQGKPAFHPNSLMACLPDSCAAAIGYVGVSVKAAVAAMDNSNPQPGCGWH